MRNPTILGLAAMLAAVTACKSGPSAAVTPSPSSGSGTGAPADAPATAAPIETATVGVTTIVPDPPKQVTQVEGITEYALDNGMRVLLFPDPSKETLTVNVTYLVGSRHEGYGESGMAHLLEHMLFKGTPKHPKVWDELNARGASNNATTWFDRTNYFETLPASDDNLAWALEMEADRMVNANISQNDLNSEFTVVRNEFESGENDPGAVLSERIWSTAFLWHNYGKSTIGSRADIEKVPATRLKDFYKKYYRPDNAVLAVAGKIDPAKTLDLVNKTFGTAAKPATPLQATYTVEPAQDGDRSVTLRRNGDVAIVGMLYHVPAGSDPAFPAIEAAADALASEPSGRLYQALVKTGMATAVTAFALPLHDPGTLEITVTVASGKAFEPVRDKMIEIVEGLAKKPITAEEVGRFKAKQKKGFKLSFANSQAVALGLSEWAAMGDWRLLFVHRDWVEKLTPEAVNAAAATYFVASNRTLGVFIPTKTPVRAPLEERKDIGPVVRDYKGRQGASEGENFEATVENIEKRTKRVTYKGGLKAAYLAKETRGDAVQARLTLRYGTEKDLKGLRLASDFLGRMMARGTKKHTFQQLKDEWDRLEARVSFGSGPGELTVNIATVRDNLPDVLALVDEVLHDANFPADQFEIATKELVTDLEKQRSEPQDQAVIALRRALTPRPADHPEYVPTTDEELAGVKALKLDTVKKLYPLLGAGNATFTIVGDYDAAVIEPWVEKTWGNWKSPKPYKRIETVFIETKPGEVIIDTPDKENALMAAGYAVKMRDDDADYPAMVIVNYALGGGGFSSRLMIRLRQKDGLSYGAGSQFQADSLDQVGVLLAFAILAPSNAVKGMKAMLEEVDRLVNDGLPTTEVKSAQDAVAKGFQRSLASDGFVLATLHDGLFIGRTMEFYAKQQAAIAALTADQVNAAIKKYVKSSALFRVTGGDKKKMGL
jgi:zinc protease